MRSKRLLTLLLVSTVLGCRSERGKLAELTVSIADRKVTLSSAEWRAMPNETEYARNFEAVSNRPPRQYQIVTFFLNSMSEDRKSGEQISPNEYLEVFLSNPDEITVLLRRDHGSYWVLSREMFRAVPVSGVSTNRIGSFATPDAQRVTGALRNQIDSTRYLLGQRLLAR